MAIPAAYENDVLIVLVITELLILTLCIDNVESSIHLSTDIL